MYSTMHTGVGRPKKGSDPNSMICSRTLDIAGQVLLTEAYRPPRPPEAKVPCGETRSVLSMSSRAGLKLLSYAPLQLKIGLHRGTCKRSRNNGQAAGCRCSKPIACGSVTADGTLRPHTSGKRHEGTHEEQVVARLHAILLREGREVVGCAGLNLLLGGRRTRDQRARSVAVMVLPSACSRERMHMRRAGGYLLEGAVAAAAIGLPAESRARWCGRAVGACSMLQIQQIVTERAGAACLSLIE
jgi:hypothetical protein